MRTLPAWEMEYGRAFLVGGERVVDEINDALAAKELLKEAKKVCFPTDILRYLDSEAVSRLKPSAQSRVSHQLRRPIDACARIPTPAHIDHA